MLKEERQLAILNEVDLHNRVLLSDIAEKLEVSIDTIRRDVKELDAENKLKKVHGGAISLGFTGFGTLDGNVYAQQEKKKIANKALEFLKEDSVIFIDGGTTCLELAKAIPTELSLSCFTFSLPVAMLLLSKPNIKVILLGGELSKDAQIAIGPTVIRQLQDIKFDYSFIGTGYVDSLHGLTEFDWDIVQVKKAVVEASKKTVLLCISEKLNSQHRFRTCDINEINTMITELDPINNRLNLFRNQDIRLL